MYLAKSRQRGRATTYALAGLALDFARHMLAFALFVTLLSFPAARPVAQRIADAISAPLAGRSRVVMSNAPKPGMPGQARKVRVR